MVLFQIIAYLLALHNLQISDVYFGLKYAQCGQWGTAKDIQVKEATESAEF